MGSTGVHDVPRHTWSPELDDSVARPHDQAGPLLPCAHSEVVRHAWISIAQPDPYMLTSGNMQRGVGIVLPLDVIRHTARDEMDFPHPVRAGRHDAREDHSKCDQR